MVHPAIPPSASNPNLLNGLVAKRAEIAGRIELATRDLQRLNADLEAIDATIRLFEPAVDISAVRPRLLARYEAEFRGEIIRHVYDALREATGPLTSRDIGLLVINARGLDPGDPRVVSIISKRVFLALAAKQEAGIVRRIERGRWIAWELDL